MSTSTSFASLPPAAARGPARPGTGRLPLGLSVLAIAGLSGGLWAAVFWALGAVGLL